MKLFQHLLRLYLPCLTEYDRLYGHTILKCALDRESCGEYHSIKWYKDGLRIAVYSQMHNFQQAEGDFQERVVMETDNSTMAWLKISPVKLEDEGLYKCEITYLDIGNI